MNLHSCYNASEDTFPLPRHIKERYGPFGFPAPADARRPYITSNFVMGLDGRASFRELKGRTDGATISRSKEDRWLMDFCARTMMHSWSVRTRSVRNQPLRGGAGTMASMMRNCGHTDET